MKIIYRQLFLLLCFSSTFYSNAQTATFNITYNGFTPEAQAAFQYAANQWSHIVVSTVPIKVNATFANLVPGMLGITFPNGRLNFSGAPLTDTWYATSLANAITATELNPGESDIDVYLNSGINWYFDTAGTVPAAQYDFVSVVMHELCHGLGFVSLAKKTGATGSFGTLTQTDFFPFVTTFPWPELDTLPCVFDRLLVKPNLEKLDTLDNPSTTLGTALTSNNVFLNGTFTLASNNNIKPKIYAPSTFELGSSISHLNEATYPAGTPNEMMTPNGTPGDANHSPGPITIGVLRDIGWNINPALSSNDLVEQSEIKLFPNPATNALVVLSNQSFETRLTVSDVTGKILLTKNNYKAGETINVSKLMPGYYFLTLENDDELYRKAFVKQ